MTGPIAPQNNPPIDPQYYKPLSYTIANIVSGLTTTVTVTPSFGVSNTYVVGQTIRFVIPLVFGMRQLNGLQTIVTQVLGNTFVVPIDSRYFDSYIPSPPYAPTPAQVVAVGDINSGLTNVDPKNVGTVIPGSFVNVS